jgi:hypothetical protein
MVTRIRFTVLSAGLAALAACASESTPPAPPPPPEVEIPATGLDARALLVRASLDIRGVRPSADELALVGADATALDGLFDSMVEDPRLADRVASIFADALRTRRDAFYFAAYHFGLDEARNGELQHAIGNEALHLVRHVVASGAPITEIVTADYTVVDPILLEIWPLEALETLPDGTVKARYLDGRPAAGVLATNSFHWRHRSTFENANRGRSNAMSRALLCADYLDRPIDFPTDVDLTDTESIHQAIRENAACQACHATLDPFASHLWGFMQPADEAYTHGFYHPENELQWKVYTEAVPAYFGTPTDGTLSALGRHVAADPRFVACTVRRVYERMLGRPASVEDEGQLTLHREALLGSSLSIKALVRSVLDDPAYRGIAQKSVYGGQPDPIVAKLASPELLTSMLADLAGYLPSIDGRSATSIDYGVRALAGGSERGSSATPSIGHVLVHRRLAEGAARSLAEGASPTSRVGALLSSIDPASRPSAALVAAVVREIRSTELGEDAAEVGALLALWDAALAATSDASEATTALLTAVFADPELVVY